METYLLSILVLFFVPLLLFLFSFFNSNSKPSIGYIEFLRNFNRLVDWSAELLRESPRGVVVTKAAVLVADPDAIQHVTKTHFDRYSKDESVIHALHDFIGDSISVSIGERWSVQRKAISRELYSRRFRCFTIEAIQDGARSKLIPFLRRAAEDGRVLDVQDVLGRFAFDNICKIMLDMELGLLGLEGDDREGALFASAFTNILHLTMERFSWGPEFMWRARKFVGVSSERKLKESLAIADGRILKEIQAKREQKGRNANDFISRLISIYQDKPDKYFRDIAMNLVFGGHDTTSTALSWLFWLMSTRPDVEENILKEIITIRRNSGSLAGEAFTKEEISQMNYLRASLSEALRLYPPFPLINIACIKDDVLPDGTLINKGRIILYNSFVMARMERLWGKECNKFMPERWLDEDGIHKPTDNYRFPVFHSGPRVCLGKDFAYKTMMVMVATMIERFEVLVIDKMRTPSYVTNPTLHMVDGLRVKVKERKISTA